jgi:hypothetical protein
MHSHEFDNERTFLVLRDYLPYSLPLYRRVQSPHRSTSAKILASFPEDDSSRTTTRGKCFVLAFADRSVRPETETWIFAPGETPSHAPPGGTCTCFHHIRALLFHLAKQRAPKPTPTVAGNDSALSSHLGAGNIMLCGAIADVWARAMRDAGVLWSAHPSLARPCALITLDRSVVAEKRAGMKLPEGIRAGCVSRAEDFEVVRARSEIPRRVETLRALPSRAYFHNNGEEEELVAWAFLGTDLSLSTLHVEPEWRRRGLGGMLTAELVEESCGPEGVSHSYVFTSNAPSMAMFAKIGGSVLAECHWLRVDLDKVEESTKIS